MTPNEALAQSVLQACRSLGPAREKSVPLPHFRRALTRGSDVRVIDFGPVTLRTGESATGAAGFDARLQAALRTGLLHAHIFVQTDAAIDDRAASGVERLRSALGAGAPDFAVWRVGLDDARLGVPAGRVEAAARQALGLARTAGVEMTLVGSQAPDAVGPTAARDAVMGALARAARDMGSSFIDAAAAPAPALVAKTALDGPLEPETPAPSDCLPEWIAGRIVDGVRAAMP